MQLLQRCDGPGASQTAANALWQRRVAQALLLYPRRLLATGASETANATVALAAASATLQNIMHLMSAHAVPSLQPLGLMR
jgi:hypothetical protein